MRNLVVVVVGGWVVDLERSCSGERQPAPAGGMARAALAYSYPLHFLKMFLHLVAVLSTHRWLFLSVAVCRVGVRVTAVSQADDDSTTSGAYLTAVLPTKHSVYNRRRSTK